MEYSLDVLEAAEARMAELLAGLNDRMYSGDPCPMATPAHELIETTLHAVREAMAGRPELLDRLCSTLTGER